MDQVPEPRDRGLALERTVLAFNRSGVAVLVCVAVLLRHIWPLHGTDQFVALACVSAAAVAWAVALSFGRALWSRTRRATVKMSDGRALVITAGTLALALAGLIVAFLPT